MHLLDSGWCIVPIHFRRARNTKMQYNATSGAKLAYRSTLGRKGIQLLARTHFSFSGRAVIPLVHGCAIKPHAVRAALLLVSVCQVSGAPVKLTTLRRSDRQSNKPSFIQLAMFKMLQEGGDLHTLCRSPNVLMVANSVLDDVSSIDLRASSSATWDLFPAEMNVSNEKMIFEKKARRKR